MKNIGYILLFFFIGLSAQNDKVFDQANALFNEGKFTEAIDRYELILDTDKHSAELYYNIANAHYKLNHIAPSIYYYEKALALKPKDKDKLFVTFLTKRDKPTSGKLSIASIRILLAKAKLFIMSLSLGFNANAFS